MSDAEKKYGQIIYRLRPVSEKHSPMPREMRAAQFAPFAALNGYDDLIEDSARFTDKKKELSDEQKKELGERIGRLAESGEKAHFTVFVQDAVKEGGVYITFEDAIKACDSLCGIIYFMSGKQIYAEDLYEVD